MNTSFDPVHRRPQSRRIAHFEALRAARWPDHLIAAILRCSSTIQTCANRLSSVEMTDEETRRCESRDERATARAERIANRMGCVFSYSGDPRGCPLLLSPDSTPQRRITPRLLPTTGWGGGYALD